MAVSTQAAYGMYPHDVALQQVVQTLNQSGFGKEDICMMVSPRHPIAAIVREANILMYTAISKALVGLGFSEGDALRFERQLRPGLRGMPGKLKNDLGSRTTAKDWGPRNRHTGKRSGA